MNVFAVEFGNTSSVEFIGAVPYFYEFVEYFVKLGYVKGVNIQAAPYDWRLSPGIHRIMCCTHGTIYSVGIM